MTVADELKSWLDGIGKYIESFAAARRQAGREEADKEIKRYEAFAERRIAKIGSDIEALNYRYAALVEAARPFAQYEDGDAGKCWDPSRIKLGKALSDLDEARKECE